MDDERFAPDDVVLGPDEEAALLELAGFTAYVRLGLFGLIAKHTYGAPGLRAAQRMQTIAVRIGQQQQALLNVGAERGVDPVALMRPFGGLFDSFEARTAESSWWEGVLKAVVGHGVASDLCRLLARGLPDEVGAAVRAALVHADRDKDLRITQMIAVAAERDPVLASRLSLWGRRVAGESLTLSWEILQTRLLLADLAETAYRLREEIPLDLDSDEPVSRHSTRETLQDLGSATPLRSAQSGMGEKDDEGMGAIAWVLDELKAEHSRRMERMGLAG
ncbi:MAG: ferritin-like domain-containing protein [Promicromonosporaceae bacterium]|nr:ferritin-like domain-containing protein [Promicromonosporaceae bacterium]